MLDGPHDRGAAFVATKRLVRMDDCEVLQHCWLELGGVGPKTQLATISSAPHVEHA